MLQTHVKEPLIFLKNTASSVPTVLSLDNGDIANTFNLPLAETTKNYHSNARVSTKKK